MYTLMTLLRARARGSEEGFVTAEHLGVAALAISALVVIFAGMEALGTDVVGFIRDQLGV